jgi:hypothetical protein
MPKLTHLLQAWVKSIFGMANESTNKSRERDTEAKVKIMKNDTVE